MTLEQMLRHIPPRRGRQPLLKTEILELRCLKDFQEFQLFISDILNVVSHALRYNANISGHVVERARSVGGGEDSDASSATNEERPLVGVWVPVHLADAVGLHCDMCGGDGLADGEVTGVGNADLASGGLDRVLSEHLVCEAMSRLLDPNRTLLVNWPGHRTLEDVAFGGGDVVKYAGVEAEVFGKD